MRELRAAGAIPISPNLGHDVSSLSLTRMYPRASSSTPPLFASSRSVLGVLPVATSRSEASIAPVAPPVRNYRWTLSPERPSTLSTSVVSNTLIPSSCNTRDLGCEFEVFAFEQLRDTRDRHSTAKARAALGKLQADIAAPKITRCLGKRSSFNASTCVMGFLRPARARSAGLPGCRPRGKPDRRSTRVPPRSSSRAAVFSSAKRPSPMSNSAPLWLKSVECSSIRPSIICCLRRMTPAMSRCSGPVVIPKLAA